MRGKTHIKPQTTHETSHITKEEILYLRRHWQDVRRARCRRAGRGARTRPPPRRRRGRRPPVWRRTRPQRFERSGSRPTLDRRRASPWTRDLCSGTRTAGRSCLLEGGKRKTWERPSRFEWVWALYKKSLNAILDNSSSVHSMAFLRSVFRCAVNFSLCLRWLERLSSRQ